MTSGSGNFGGSGSAELFLDSDGTWSTDASPQTGAYLYTKTAANTATLMLNNPDFGITTTTVLTYTSASGGTFKTTGFGLQGSQGGTFFLLP